MHPLKSISQGLRPAIVSLILLGGLLSLPLSGFAAEGLLYEHPSLHPGKADFHYRHTKSTDEYNGIWWSPVFKGGTGWIRLDSGGQTEYTGGYLRPWLRSENKGELILGFLQVDTPRTYSYEFQAEYRTPFGFGIGGGNVSRSEGGRDVEFGKISYRNAWQEWKYILATQYQQTDAQDSAGGYVALYNDQWMLTYGNDGEQWRSAFGYLASLQESWLRPAMEVLYVDNTIGQFAGNEFLFINATLGYKGGFLSHPARLGRAMGPTGLEFGNPLGFLRPTWNRRLDVWELGGLADLRFVRTETPAGTTTERLEGLVFPFQWDQQNNPLDVLYLGGFYAREATANSPGILAGLIGKMGSLQIGVGADFNFETDEKRIMVGIIEKF